MKTQNSGKETRYDGRRLCEKRKPKSQVASKMGKGARFNDTDRWWFPCDDFITAEVCLKETRFQSLDSQSKRGRGDVIELSKRCLSSSIFWATWCGACKFTVQTIKKPMTPIKWSPSSLSISPNERVQRHGRQRV
ncbi:hypothetical protein OH492_10625 [Vibrio chagasii]|nr:hypothetical protein [Vibrio chagasii]